MAPNKFASMLHRHTNKLTLVLAYVLLEWILIALILLNSLFSYLSVKFADYFGLKRPCTLCSRIDHGSDKRVTMDTICNEHALEISELGFCKIHNKLVKCGQSQNMCQNCCPMMETSLFLYSRCSCCDDMIKYNPVLPVMDESRDLHVCDVVIRNEENGIQREEQNIEQEQQEVVIEEDVIERYEEPHAHVNTGNDHESVFSDCSDVIYEIEEHEESQKQDSMEIENESKFEAKLGLEEQEVGLIALDESPEYTLMVEKLTTALYMAYAELEQERNDAEIASSQTMAMITKFQEEKAALLLEASQYQIITNEQIAFDEGDVLHLDEAKLEVKIEVEQQENGISAASTIEKLTKALNDAYVELEQERNDAAEVSTQTMAMITKLQDEKAALQLEASQYQRMMDEQIAYDEEAVILLDDIVRRRERENHELEKELEFYKKRFTDHEKHEKTVVSLVASESVSVCCSSFGDQDSDGVTTEDDEHQNQIHYESDDDPLVDLEDERLSILNKLNELEQKLVEINTGEFEEEGIKEEIGNVHERLHGLEEDKEFLKNCIKSVKKGDEGMCLVHEILQHLRALRRMDI